MTIRFHPEKATTKARLRRAALFWGLPFTVLELIGAPFGPGVFILAVPIFIASTAAAFATDLAIVKLGQKLTKPPHQ